MLKEHQHHQLFPLWPLWSVQRVCIRQKTFFILCYTIRPTDLIGSDYLHVDAADIFAEIKYSRTRWMMLLHWPHKQAFLAQKDVFIQKQQHVMRVNECL